MSPAEVDRLARGQVFTGRQAQARGLVDELGGLDEALSLLKDQAGIGPQEEVTLIHLPRPKSLLERLAEGKLVTMVTLLGGDAPPSAWQTTETFWRQCLSPEESLAIYWGWF
jgi:ClpP class serine protease